MKILILGHNGMLGNAVHKYFNKFDVEIIEDKYRWNSDEFKHKVIVSNAEFIINCIGAIPQKKYVGEYYNFINVELPEFLEITGKKVIHPSTDCEFSGYLEYPEKYNKDAIRDADDDYGKSKAKISKTIVENFKNTKIIRTSIVGHELSTHLSLLDWFLGTKDDEILKGYGNYYWNGITTLEWCKSVEKMMLEWNFTPILIQIGTNGLSKYELLKKMGKIYNKSNIINEFNMEKPLNKMLKSDFLVEDIEQQLIELKSFYNK